MLKLFKKRKPTNQVKTLRETLGLTQKGLAAKVEAISLERVGKVTPLSWQTVRSIEEFCYIPTFGLAQLIAEALEEDLEVVFFKLT